MAVAEMHHSDPVRPRWLVRGVVDPLLLALLCTLFFWKLVLTNQYTWLESPDIANQVLPWFQMQATEWHTGHLPLWDPYLWNGQPLLGQAQPGVVYPLNWLLFLLPLRDGFIQTGYLHWYFVVIHWMGGVFAYWLCRDLNRGRIASLFAGSLFSLGGFLGHIDWPQMLNGGVWIPLVILFLVRALDGRRSVASSMLCGIFWGFSWLGGHHQIPIFLSLIVLGSFLLRSLEISGGNPFGLRVNWRMLALAGLATVFAVAAGAVQILPALEYGRQSVRWVGAETPVGWGEKVPYSVHRQYSLNPLSLLGAIVPGWHRNADAFLGTVPLILAALATSLLWEERRIRFFFVLSIAGILLALGDFNVMHGVLYSLIPLVEKARSPGMAIIMFHFGISVLCAYAIDLYSSIPDSPWPRRIARSAFSVGVFLLGIAFLRGVWQGQQNFGDDRIVLIGFCAIAMSGLLFAWRSKALQFPALVACSFGLMILETGLVSNAALPHRSEHERNLRLEQMREHSDIARFLKSQGPGRVQLDDKAIPYNFGDWYGIETYQGYLASLTANLQQLDTNERSTIRLFGVKFLVRKEPQDPGQKLVFNGQSGLNVYQNPDALPRAWTVHRAETVRDAGAARHAVSTQDVAAKAFLVGSAPALESCPSVDQVAMVSHRPDNVSIWSKMGCRGMVILSDTAFPGWEAYIDGRPSRLYTVDVALRGVVVEEGEHRIEMKYQPWSFRIGALLSLAAAGVGLGLAFWKKPSGVQA